MNKGIESYRYIRGMLILIILYYDCNVFLVPYSTNCKVISAFEFGNDIIIK